MVQTGRWHQSTGTLIVLTPLKCHCDGPSPTHPTGREIPSQQQKMLLLSAFTEILNFIVITRKANELLPAVRAQPRVLPEHWAEQQGAGVSARCPPSWGQADGSSYEGTDSAKRLSTHLSFSMLGAVPQPTKHLSMGSKGDSGKGLKLSMVWWTWPWCCHSGNFHLPRLLFSGLFLIKTSFKKENKYLLSLMLCF